MPRRRGSGTRLRPLRDVVANPRGSPAAADVLIPCPEGLGAHGRFHAARPRPFDPKPAPALLGRAGSHAGGRPARAATLFRVLRPMRSAREQREKLPSGDFYIHARLRFPPCRHARAACDSRGARHATGAGLRVKGARHERHEGKGDGRGQGLPRAQGLRDRRRGLAGARGHRRDRPRGGGRGRDPGLRRRHGPDRDGRLPRGPQGARAARGAGGEVARRQRRRLRRHPGPLRRGGDDGRQGEPRTPSPPHQLLRRDGAALLGGAPGPGLPGPGFPPKPAPVPRKRTYTYVFVVHSACRTNPYGFVPTLRDSGRAGPDAARRAPR